MPNKIVIDTRMINTSGIGRYIKELLTIFDGEQFDVFLMGDRTMLSAYQHSSTFKIIHFNSPIYSIIEQIIFLLKVPRCDLFISPHYNIPLILPQKKKQLTIIPDVNHLVFINEFSLLKRIYARVLFFFVIRKSDIIITISDFSKSEIIKYTTCISEKIVVAKLAIDKKYFQSIDFNSCPLDYKQYKPYFLFVGNVKPHKNLKRSLLAFREIIKENSEYKFVIVGKIENLINNDVQLFDIIQKDDVLKKAVIFTGVISDEGLAYLYKNAYALIFISLYEGFGIPPLEAMFFNCPVIVSKEGSLPEICGDAVLYANAYNVSDIVSVMKSIIVDKALRENLIKKGQIKVLEYDWFFFSEILMKKIKNLLN